MKLPEPSWITLAEVLNWLAQQGISAKDANFALPRAFRNDEIRTRGRCRKYTGHDTQTRLDGIAWDNADVIDWDRNAYSVMDRKRHYYFTDVEVSRDDLINWLTGSESKYATNKPTTAQAQSIPNQIPSTRRGPKQKYDWESFYVEIAVMADLDELPDIQADLVKKMAEWCENAWGEQPSDSMLKSKISPLYRHPRRCHGQ